METAIYVITGLFLLTIALITGKKTCKAVTIYEFEKGLRYKKGKLIQVLGAGRYYYFAPATTIITMDTRPKIITVAGQELLTSDSVSIKVSIVAEYRVVNVVAAMNSSEEYHGTLYATLQTALRAIVGDTTIDELLAKRNEISGKLFEATKESVAEYGLELLSASIKDIMFPGEMKKVFAQVIKAQKEGLAALEKARGESAALRNLANAARMLEDNPNLVWLRMMQAVSETSGNTIVMNLAPKDAVLPIMKNSPGSPVSRSSNKEE